MINGEMRLMERLQKEKDVKVRITTTTDGETFVTEGAGEYAHDDEAHYVAYTERDEHGSVTRSGLHIGREKLLLHRDGAVNMKMLFDPLATTRADYSTAGFATQFAVRTRQYDVFFDEKTITIDLRYALAQDNDDPGTDFTLKIEISDA